MLIDTEKASLIYKSLADDLSKCVFTKRLAYSIVNSPKNLRELVRLLIPDFINKVEKFIECGDKVCVYGVGNSVWYAGRTACSLFYDHLAEGGVFDKRGGMEIILHGGNSVKVESPDKVCKLGLNIVVIVGTLNPEFQSEIARELLSKGIPSDRILFFPPWHLVINEDYFCNQFWNFRDKEVFIDCGCNDGDTSRSFINAVQRADGASVSKIIAYEPDEKQFEMCRKTMADLSFFQVRNAGVWNKKEVLHFSAVGGGLISDNGEVEINAISLDEDLAGEKVTFIKMDIEGAELNALKGAKKIICEQRPKLAICLYHKPEDILVIPYFIVSLNLNYKIYLRHQGTFSAETILYAVPY